MPPRCSSSRFHLCVAGWSTSKTRRPGYGIPIREGVQARAEQNILSNAGRDSPAQVVFGIAAARHQKGPQPNRERPIGPQWSPPQLLRVSLPQDRNGNRVGKDHRRVVKLVSGAAQRHAKRSSGWDGLLQKCRLSALNFRSMS